MMGEAGPRLNHLEEVCDFALLSATLSCLRKIKMLLLFDLAVKITIQFFGLES